MDEIIRHLADLVSRLWQIQAFGEGSTRTTAVFFIKYLSALGFDATNGIFAENAWYFRNALVRANNSDLKNGIYETTEYLETFLRNLLLNENRPLHNRALHIGGAFKEASKPVIDPTVADIEAEKRTLSRQDRTLSRPKWALSLRNRMRNRAWQMAGRPKRRVKSRGCGRRSGTRRSLVGRV